MHYYPGQGDPFDWPIEQFDEAVAHVPEIERRRRGEDDSPVGRVVNVLNKFVRRGR